MPNKNYKSWFMCVKAIASQTWDTIFETQCNNSTAAEYSATQLMKFATAAESCWD